MQSRWVLPLVSGLCLLVSIPAVSGPKKDDPLKNAPLIMLVGDSFTGAGFAQALKPKFNKMGFKYRSIAHTSAYTTTLARQISLPSTLAYYKPVLVIVTLGANEMAMLEPETHAHAVKNLGKLAGDGRPCVWTLPPRWNDKNGGILDVIKRDAKPCRVYDANPIAKKIPRGPDKIHPNKKGGEMWANDFWKWLFEKPKKGKPEPIGESLKKKLQEHNEKQEKKDKK
jgi:hypothetical protein